MRLKRLELHGFKSFADRTALDFAHSLTGIVGPNGCGKSNVVDAVRWVLGETRPTSMRGSGMTDVIFKGSASRPAMSMADVTLVLDNTSGVLADRGAEVSISRRVFLDGEGEYRIDGEKVRLKDVRDLLFNTGLGSRGYSVLEQGRIDAILSANPLDRRAIFEEAAGISRFRQRKKEAQARLQRVEADMLRADDVLKELASRLRSLKLQAGKAERFLSARTAFRAEKSRLVGHQLHRLGGDLERLEAELQEVEARAAHLRSDRESSEGLLAAHEHSGQGLAAEVDRTSALVASVSGDVRTLEERARQLLARIEGWRDAAAEERARSESLAEQNEKLRGESAELQRQVAHDKRELAQVEEHAAEKAQALRELNKLYKESRELSERQNDRVLEALQEKTSVKNAVGSLSHSRAALEQRMLRAGERTERAREAVEELSLQRDQRLQRAQACGREASSCRERRAEALSALSNLDAEWSRASGEKQRAELELAAARSRIAALSDLEHERELLAAGSAATLAELECGAGPCAGDELRGLFADRVRASTRCARALDAALGDRALALIVGSSEVAARIVRWLGERRSGQAALLAPMPLDAYQPAALAVPSDPAIEGRLCDLVEADPGFEWLLEALVSDVLVVLDLDAALALFARHPQWRYATCAGELVDRAGVSGGHREIAQGAIGRRSSAHELGQEALELERSLGGLEARCASLAEGRERARAELAELERELAERMQAMAEVQAEEHAFAARLAESQSHLDLFVGESAVLAAEGEQLAAELERLAAQRGSSEASFEAENGRLAELEAERHALEGKRDELARETNRAEIEVARLATQHAGLAQRASDLDRLRSNCEGELLRARKLAEHHDQHAEAKAREVNELREEHARGLAKLAEIRQQLVDLRAQENMSQAELSASRRRVDLVTRELEQLLERLSERRLEEQRLQLSRAEVIRRAGEDLELPPESPEELLASLDLRAPESEQELAALEERVEMLKRELDALGPVQLESVQELSEIETRHGDLARQRDDLARAQRSLNETIKTINAESERRFTETFEAVSEAFRGLFRQLFGGGKAELILADPSDPLESGIEISARPPGREMLSINLLSGGQRTLTALALLFAVFQARPSPFCILDEVDAALDDANVVRFLKMLGLFRAHTQFVVVTHNKGTMAACSHLYGITMETRGVSRQVSVELTDIDSIVPEAVGRTESASQSTSNEDLEDVVLTAAGGNGAVQRAQGSLRNLPVEQPIPSQE